MSKNTNLNLDDIPLTDIDYEGVIYEPSNDSSDFNTDNYTSKNKSNKSSVASSPKSKKKVAQNFNFGIFMALMFVLSFGLLSVTASILSPYLSDYISLPSSKSASTSASAKDTNTNTNIPQPTELSQVVTQNEFTGVIKELDYTTNNFVILDFKSNISYSLVSNATSIFKDKFDNPLTLQEIKIGDIVDFSFNEDNNLIRYIKINPSAFNIKNVKPEKISTIDSTIKLNGNTYSIASSTDIHKDQELITLLDLSLLDKISVSGYDNTIYSIIVNNSTGTLVFINKPSLTNAIVEIDRDYFRPLDAVDQIELEEGTHKLVIKANNVDSYLKDFNIIAGEETILDLSDVQNKFGSLLIKLNVSDYELYINNEEIEDRGYHSLRYGTYFIRAEKEGYETYETQISINKPTDTLEIELEKIEKLGSLSLTSTPDGAEVYVNNVLVGKTPLNYNLPQGTHTIKLTLDNYNDFLLTSVSISDEPAEFNITMHSKTSSNTTQATTSGAITTENQNQNMVDYIPESATSNQEQNYNTAEYPTENTTQSIIENTTSLIPDDLFQTADQESVYQSILTNYDQFNQFQSQVTTNSSQFEYPTVMTTSSQQAQTQAQTQVETQTQAEVITQTTTASSQESQTQSTTSSGITASEPTIPEIIVTPATSSHPMFEQFE